MSSKKYLLYQVYVSENPPTQLVLDSTASMKAYADRHGLDYMFEDEPNIRVRPCGLRTHPRMKFYWCMSLCRQELEHYDYVIHVDADIIAKPDAPDIRPYIKGDFQATRDPVDYLGTFWKPMAPLRRAWAFRNIAEHFGYDWWNHFNSGIWSSSPKARRLIRKKWRRKAFKIHVDESPAGSGEFPFSVGDPYGGDQNILNDIVHNSDLEFSSIPWQWNALSIGCRDRLDEAFFIHYGGTKGKDLYNRNLEK